MRWCTSCITILVITDGSTGKVILSICSRYTPELEVAPREGWLEHTRLYLLNLLFPHLDGPHDPDKFKAGRNILLQLMRGVYEYERKTLPFDPCYDINLLSNEEIMSKGFTDEYLRFNKLVKSNYVYEFMRLSSDISPFNTLGHVSGVHYVAMYTARQLCDAGINVDLGLLSAAAALTILVNTAAARKKSAVFLTFTTITRTTA